MNQEKLYAQIFHGKPVNNLPLKKSQIDKDAEKEELIENFFR